MKKVVLFVIASCLLLTACMTIKVVAPPNQEVMLMSETDASTFRMTRRAIFLIGGLIPIANNSTDDMIAKYNLENVRVTTEFDIIDWLISGVTSGLVVTKSVTIEGNAKK